MKSKRIFAIATTLGLSLGLYTGCSDQEFGTSTTLEDNRASGFDGLQRPTNVVSDTFVNDVDVVHQKGVAVPKGMFILKPDETKEDYIKSSSGPWEFKGLAKVSATGARTQYNLGLFVHKVTLVKGGSSIGCKSPAPYEYRVDLDLNRGAGGPYVYMCVQFVDVVGPPILSSSLRFGSSDYASDFNADKPTSEANGFLGVDYSNSDMNQGAGGAYVWGRYAQASATSGKCYINGIGAVYADHWWEDYNLPSGYKHPTITRDLNEGAGGSWINPIYRESCI